MKKLIAIAMLSVFCLSFAGCGSSDSSSEAESSKTEGGSTESSKVESSKVESGKDESSLVESSANDSNSGATLTMDQIVELMKSSAEQAGTDDMNVNVYAEGDTLVYEYIYKNEIPSEQISLYKTALASQLENKSIAKTMADSKEKIAKASGRDVSIRLVYKTNDGTVLGEKTY